eukprot:2015797-Rhodomonas_salina.3
MIGGFELRRAADALSTAPHVQPCDRRGYLRCLPPTRRPPPQQTLTSERESAGGASRRQEG